MSRIDQAAPPALRLPSWPGLGVWNLYFLGKFALLWLGLLNVQVLPNLLFAAFLLLPLPGRALPCLRQILAVPAGIALLYHDTWLPPFSRLLSQPGVLDFSLDYLLELTGRFIDWSLLGGLVLLMVGYCFLAPWLRLTTLSVAGLVWLGLSGLPVPSSQSGIAASEAQGALTTAAGERQPLASTLDAWLDSFFRDEAGRRTQFPPRSADAAPFDLLVINVCSLAWDDLDAVGLRDNPLFRRMDVIFDRFNSATSYSGPAAIRLLRASCGQTPHAALYEPAPEQCLLFENLARLGFQPQTLLNHNGRFDSFLDDITHQRMPQPAIHPVDFRRALVSFDGSAIAGDLDMLRGWWQQRQRLDAPRVSLFYNSISLHDGNRIVTQDGSSRSADYKTRAQILLQELTGFIDDLERSGRRVALVIVPEHGAALHGDRMQIAGMREIPRLSITRVPVGVKLIGMQAEPRDEPLHVQAPSSFLALSELVSRLYASQASGPRAPDWTALLEQLPQTAAVSETAGAQVIEHAGKPYARLHQQGTWLPYPDRTD